MIVTRFISEFSQSFRSVKCFTIRAISSLESWDTEVSAVVLGKTASPWSRVYCAERAKLSRQDLLYFPIQRQIYAGFFQLRGPLIVCGLFIQGPRKIFY